MGIIKNDLTFNAAVCPVCDSDRRTSLFYDNNRREGLPISGSYVSCQSCGMIYLHPVPDWQQFKEFYDRLFLENHPPDVVPTMSLGDRPDLLGIVLHKLRRFRFRPHSWPLEPGTGRRILDVGCGIGFKLIEFSRRGWQVFGTDISPSALDLARRKLPEGTFFLGELDELSLEPGSFDVIRVDNVLEHVPSPRGLLQESSHLLTPDGGRLFVFVPHGRSLSIRLLGKYSISSWIPFHLSLFTPDTLKRVLHDAGFRQVEILQYSPMSWLPSSLKHLVGIGSEAQLSPFIEWSMMLALWPIGAIAARIGWGEELVAVAQK